MINGLMEYISELGMGWGIVLIIAFLVIAVGVFLRIQINNRT